MGVLALSTVLALLSIANPTLKNPLEGEGIVLIDEIDLHLHPSWQRQLVPRLSGTFPNCPFLITTHSPQVLGEIRPESLRLLDLDQAGSPICYPPRNSLGLSSNKSLNEVLLPSAANSLDRNPELAQTGDF